jgi:glycerol-3-phosphate dehydrogenase
MSMTAQSPSAQSPSHQSRLAGLPREVDLIVIGGGITGAGIALEAIRGAPSLRVLLVEGHDYAYGTSSRSSKLVHGGLRYLKDGKPALTLESVQERNQLMRDAPGLVDPMPFLMPHYKGGSPSKGTIQAALWIYDIFAAKRTSGAANASEAQRLAPGIDSANLTSASTYLDATTDDARLVLRVLTEARKLGVHVVNYLPAIDLLRKDDDKGDNKGDVIGVRVQASDSTEPIHIHARCVIAATGVWADRLRGQLGQPPKLRPLRGSHLMISHTRLPLTRAVAMMHPDDRRPVFAYPWQGETLIGTTDLDHPDLDNEPSISRAEVDYLLRAMNAQFPSAKLADADILSTWAGVRPVIDSGKGLAPSKESRDHMVLHEAGLISVTGGKLTTFRRIARDTLQHARAKLPGWRPVFDDEILPESAAPANLARTPSAHHARLRSAFGSDLAALIDAASDDDLALMPGTRTLPAELLWSARHEQVLHLDDLLLRRTRLGLTQRGGAVHLLPALKDKLCAALVWDDARWDTELIRYQGIIARCYSLPTN